MMSLRVHVIMWEYEDTARDERKKSLLSAFLFETG